MEIKDKYIIPDSAKFGNKTDCYKLFMLNVVHVVYFQISITL